MSYFDELKSMKLVDKRMAFEESNNAVSLLKLPVYRLSDTGKIIREWTNVKEASAETGARKRNLAQHNWCHHIRQRLCVATDNTILEEIKPFLFFAFNKQTQKDYVFSKLTDAVTETGLKPKKIMVLFFLPKDKADWVFICMNTGFYGDTEV